MQGIFVQLVPDPDDMDLTMLIADIEALFAIGLCGVALIGVNKKSLWCFYLPSMLFTPVDGVYWYAFVKCEAFLHLVMFELSSRYKTSHNDSCINKIYHKKRSYSITVFKNFWF